MSDEPALGVHPRVLLFFVDDTGHDQFADPQFPVFGLGGCAVIAEALEAVVRVPWRRMKADHFDGADKPLHAADLRNPTPDQLNALSTFFTTTPIGRFAATASIRTKLPAGMKPYEAVASSLLNRFAELANRVAGEVAGIAMIYEGDGGRGDELLATHLGSMRIVKDGIDLPHVSHLMRKGEEALEVADFIIHTAGCQSRTWASGSKHSRRDFSDIFQTNPLWSSFAYTGWVSPAQG